jgi:hypothetical protein
MIGLMALATVPAVSGRATAAEPMRFGIDSDAVTLAKSRGVAISYGTFWLGAWTQKYGWAEAESQLKAAAAANVTPVIQWWYWGDDISPSCVENGCNDRYHNVLKTKATWYSMSQELAQLIVRTIGTREAIVIIETEFNKNGTENYEPFDGYLADHIAIFKNAGNIKTVVGFGNWSQSTWSRFDRAVAASDFLGVQLLRSSVREPATYMQAITTLIDGAKYLKNTFNKPSLVTDLALSSYPSTSYESNQEVMIEELFKRMNELKDVGVRGILYRMLVDDPNFDTANYHGMAERYWGLLRADKTEKPAFARFVAGIKAENATPTPTPTPAPAPPAPAPPAPTPAPPAPAPAPNPAPPAPAPPAPPTISGAPRNLRATVAGSSVRFDWDAPSDATGVSAYVLEAGSAPGAANYGTLVTTTPMFAVPAVPNGVYYVRVRSIVNGVPSETSNEVSAVVGGARPTTCDAAPAAPSLGASAAGAIVTLTWTTPTSSVNAYRLDVGSAAGQSNILTAALPGTMTTLVASAPPGTYFLRLTATNSCGASAASNEVALTVR